MFLFLLCLMLQFQTVSNAFGVGNACPMEQGSLQSHCDDGTYKHCEECCKHRLSCGASTTLAAVNQQISVLIAPQGRTSFPILARRLPNDRQAEVWRPPLSA